MPRPRISQDKAVHIGVSMPPRLWAATKEVALRRHTSASGILREALVEYMTSRGLVTVAAPAAEPRMEVPA